MGWFDEQIRQRVQNDDDIFADSFAQLANLVNGSRKLEIRFHTDQELAGEAIGEILKFYHVHAQELPANLTTLDEVLEYLLRPSGIMRRHVRLRDKWYKDASGAMLGSLKDGRFVALVPGGVHGYDYIDPDTKKAVKITRSNVDQIDREAICFYKSFPLRELGIKDLVQYMYSLLLPRDYVLMIGLMAVVTGIGLLYPYLTGYLNSTVLNSRSEALLAATLSTMLFASLSAMLVTQVHQILKSSIEKRISLSVESATMMRVLSLEPSFFKQYSAGELSNRISGINSLCSSIFDAVFSTGLTALFSLVYIFQITRYAAALLAPALVITALSLTTTMIITLRQIKVSRAMMEEGSKESGLVYQLIGGVAKIKNAGAEKRAFAKWAHQYSKTAKYRYDPELLLKLSPAISSIITMVGNVVMFYTAIGAGITYGNYMAFSAAYGNVEGAFSALMSMGLMAAQIRPLLEMVEPVLKAVPEISENKQVITSLSGGVEVNNVSFRYNEGMPLVLDNLSLKIRPGQYVAIVGKTGCGKSTLMRLMLGFEKPDRGAIFYDGKDLQSVDVKSLRSKIGCVMQNGKLFQGDIFSNIVIAAPGATLDDAWDAADMAGLSEDIENMPMGMNTLISEGQGGISGGQRQRILIARAVAAKPKILMFDEATSALDNITQKVVSDSLDQLKCTRIVIAHRLSTIRNCDRIIVLDGGKIIEDGTYDELIAQNGFFSDLVERQRVDV